MPSLPADFAFEPKVWSDHVDAYFDKKLVFGAFALTDRTLTSEPGTTLNFPYFKAIGAAEEPGADEALGVDKLEDDSFSVTIKEIGKAVGVRRAALRKSASRQDRIFSQVQKQIARVMAEKVDADLIAEINTVGNYIQGYTSTTAATHKCTVEILLEGKIVAFGDKSEDAVVCFMHSIQYLDMMTHATSGFLKADANDPWYNVPGFKGRIAGMALVVTDQSPAHATIDSNTAYEIFICKANAYGFMVAEEPDMEYDYDILHREHVFAGTQWYGVKGFHGKINALDKKIARLSVVTRIVA